jgi:carbamoyl-phosphate synthase small subunit
MITTNNFSPATLALADGTIFQAKSFGAPVTVTGEIVFNTGMTGYQEILTDPSYCGQLVTMTCPHIGNVGINPEDAEANRPWVAGLIVREVSRKVSNWRATQSLPDYLQQNNLPGLTEVDTRALVRHIRTAGAMMAVISTGETCSPDELVDMARSATPMEGYDLVREVTCAKSYDWEEEVIPEWKLQKTKNPTTFHVVAYDFGIKHNILRWLTEVGCRTTVVPATMPADDVIAMKPDGIFLSNGPGDPAAVIYAINSVREFVKTDIPIFGICLGHQILGLALGGTTHKLKFGHRGSNQPVQDENSRAVAITSHNHGFAVSAGSLPAEVEVTHLNLNDGCIEGLRHKHKPIFSIQYHPEASPGPHDALGFFKDFADMMK